jgi:hypothetical protein
LQRGADFPAQVGFGIGSREIHAVTDFQ